MDKYQVAPLGGEIALEYRAKIPLKLGENIKMIATDSPEHQKMIRDYLDDNNLCSVTVITFATLEKENTSQSFNEINAGKTVSGFFKPFVMNADTDTEMRVDNNHP